MRLAGHALHVAVAPKNDGWEGRTYGKFHGQRSFETRGALRI